MKVTSILLSLILFGGVFISSGLNKQIMESLSPWICNPRVFEVRIYNPPYHFGSQTLMLINGGLQIHRDRQ